MIVDFKQVNNLIGVLLSFLSGITFAFYSLYFEKSGLKGMETYKICFYISLFSSSLAFINAIFTGDLILLKSLEGWGTAAIFSVLVTVFAVAFFQTGIRYIGAQKSSILSTLEPVTSIIAGILFLNEYLNISKILAIFLILTSAIVLIKLTGKKDPGHVDHPKKSFNI